MDAIICAVCGSVYALTTYTRAQQVHQHCILCAVCGRELLRWEGNVCYFAKLTQRGHVTPPPADRAERRPAEGAEA